MQLEKMDEFFNKRADTYDSHMIEDLKLDEFYEAITVLFNGAFSGMRLLDLGCGTGLELERLFKRYPDMKVTGIDISQGMLDKMKNKFPGKQLNLICASYFDLQLPEEAFDFVLSTYSLHHFNEEQKLLIYRKAYNVLVLGGMFIEGDYTVNSLEKQEFHIAENERLRTEAGIMNGFFHYDTPLTTETQMSLVVSAGFSDVRVMRQWENTSIIKARK
jgi:tRNA (cmo5U34)-methyltransferase